jgi:hypothetical protein
MSTDVLAMLLARSLSATAGESVEYCDAPRSTHMQRLAKDTFGV